MFIDFRELENETTINADVCIIGAGAAGITLAREFNNTNINACLLESGGLEFDSAIQSLYDLRSVGLNGGTLQSSRLRYFGGTTNHWVGWCAPFLDIDFEQREWVANSGWPINKQILDPFYERAQKVCQLGPYRYDVASLARNSSDFPNYNPEKLQTCFWQFSPPPPTRFGMVYRAELKDSKNVSVYLYANVTQIESDETASTVRSVSIETLAGKKGSVKAKFIILACGGIENSRLLLLSNSVQREGLGNSNDIVGRYFLRHLEFETADVILNDPASHLYMVCRYRHKEYRVRAGIRLAEQIQRARRTLNYGANIKGRKGGESGSHAYTELRKAFSQGRWPDEFAQKLWAVLTDLDDVISMIRNTSSDGGLEQCEDFVNFQLSTFCEQVPNPDSRIYLDEAKDPLGYRKSVVDWRLTELEKMTIKTANTLIAEEFGRLGVGRLKLPEWLLDEGDAWLQSVWGGYHLMGGTRMSENIQTGVVDPNCKLHSVDNLFISGSSVFPTSSFVNPTLTIVTLALRLADHIKRII